MLAVKGKKIHENQQQQNICLQALKWKEFVFLTKKM